MSLDDFRTIADEKTRHLQISPELERKILRNCRKRSRPVGRAAWTAAAACFVLMVVSGVALFSRLNPPPHEDGLIVTARLTQSQMRGGDDASEAHKLVIENESRTVQVNDGIEQDDSQKGIDFSSLPKPAQVGEFSEGYAPAQNEEGLWGYVDINEKWVLAPVYVSVTPVENLQSTAVRQDGKSVTPLFPKIEQ